MPLLPMHPGEILREDVLPALRRTRGEVARLLGISRQTLYSIVSERAPVTPEMALRLGKLCGNGPELWLALQSRFDLARLSKAKETEIAAIPTLAVASDSHRRNKSRNSVHDCRLTGAVPFAARCGLGLAADSLQISAKTAKLRDPHVYAR